jgi:hypothetical protein
MEIETKVIIDPLVNIYYASFYIQGLFDKYGRKNIIFNSKPFENIKDRTANFNFIIVKNKIETKYSIHFNDFYHINKELYNWCAVYGNVNANFIKTPVEFHSKLVSLAPSFGIRVWNLPDTFYYAAQNAFKIRYKTNLRKFLGKYKRQWLFRLPYSNYYPEYQLTRNNLYIFHLSTLWYNDKFNNNDAGVNLTRACKSIDSILFEGGFVSQSNRSSNEKFSDCLYDKEISMQIWIENTRKSAVVFNTPAFWDCHGWKLGEYLALGKAIISTPISNDLPLSLVHGENIHIVENNFEEIRKAIILIIKDDEYRHKLEKGAHLYWEKYGTPSKSLELLEL